ncbi:MAG TPA: hypothetical protein DCY94_03510 [Firmicutes bacterium]|nr:hypothetical protein [Bacillota bacterium]
MKLYTDIVNPRAYLEDYTVRERSFIISKVDQVLNARFAVATKDIDTLERATQNGTLEEEALKFSTEEIQNLLEIVTHMVSRTDDHRQKYLAILEASKVKRPKETATMITLKSKK